MKIKVRRENKNNLMAECEYGSLWFYAYGKTEREAVENLEEDVSDFIKSLKKESKKTFKNYDFKEDSKLEDFPQRSPEIA